MEDLLQKYLDPRNPGSFGGVERFFRSVEGRVEDRDHAKRILQHADPYTINKESRKRFPRNRVLVTNLRQQYQIDLADMKKYKEENRGIQYLLVAVDCFSKLASVQPLQTKGATHVKAALLKVFEELGGSPDKIQADKGSEFYNSTIQTLLKSLQVRLFSSENNDIKAGMAERLIRTLKARIWRLFRYRLSTVYHDKLQDLVHSYNHSVHSSHGMRPVDVNMDNSLHVNAALSNMDTEPVKIPRYKVGDQVRIAKIKKKFEKGFEYRFQERLYKIYQVIHHAVPVYRIETLKGALVKGKFYEQELSLVRGDPALKTYPIEKIIKERVRKGKKECLVRWLGYDSDEDEWIPCTKQRLST